MEQSVEGSRNLVNLQLVCLNKMKRMKKSREYFEMVKQGYVENTQNQP